MTGFGTPLGPHAIRLLLLGSGELGKEVAIEAQLGVEVIAADPYAGAPAMQVAHRAMGGSSPRPRPYLHQTDDS